MQNVDEVYFVSYELTWLGYVLVAMVAVGAIALIRRMKRKRD